jgi:hypothetical protein
MTLTIMTATKIEKRIICGNIEFEVFINDNLEWTKKLSVFIVF